MNALSINVRVIQVVFELDIVSCSLVAKVTYDYRHGEGTNFPQQVLKLVGQCRAHC